MSGQVRPHALTAEHLDPPIVIGQQRPRLSWQLSEGSAPQFAYELEATDDDGGLWNDYVESSQQTLVPWIGPDLRSRQRRAVRVRIYGPDGSPSAWSDPLEVEAGLLLPSDWQARYITSSEDLDRPVLLRTTFTLSGPIQRARLYISYRGLGEARLNGIPAGDEVLAPGWQSYRHRELYSTLDVTEALREGTNELAVLLADGWWRGRLGFLQQKHLYGDRLSVLAQLEIEQNGQRRVVTSDASWKWSVDPTTASSLYDGETYDARLKPAAHRASLRSVEVLPAALGPLQAPIGPPVRRIEEIRPTRVFLSPSGKTLVDFGQNLVGRLRIQVRGPAGTVVTLRHAEVLEDGELGVRPLRSAAATDTYTLAGSDASEQWEPRFTYHGFRYVQVDGWPGQGPTLRDLTAVVLHTDMTRSGWFTSSNPDLNRLHENVVWSMRGNFVSIPTDCPQRDERLGWTGDISVFGPTATYLFDCVGMLSSWLQDLALEQHPDGLVPFFVPDVPFPDHVRDVPGLALSHTAVWGDAAVLVPFALYSASGDVQILQRQYESMRRWVDGVAGLVGHDLVWDRGFQFGDWLDPLAPPDNPAAGATETALVATGYFANSVKLLALAADLTDQTADYEHYTRMAAEVASAFRNRFIRADGTMSSDTQTAYAIALVLDLLPTADARDAAGARLAALVRESGHRIATGFVGTALVLDALVLAGAMDDAYALLLQTECPSWLYPVRMGATTVWERWDSMLPDGSINPGEMTSFNHYALGAVADWLHRVVGGLSADVPGWSRLRIAPRPGGGITHASTSHLTPYGMAAVAWQLNRGLIRLEATVPAGATALVDLPGENTWQLGPGVHVLERPWPYDPTKTTTAVLAT